MAQLYYLYGSMSASKSANLLMVAHNYRSQGKEVLLFSPATDDRDGVGIISSRAGMSEEAIPLYEDDDISDITRVKISDMLSSGRGANIHCLLVDEAQFLTKEQVMQLVEVVDHFDIPVMCYGLKNDFQNNLFEGSEALLIHADKIQEIKTICSKSNCGKKAIMSIRLRGGKPVYKGEQVVIGDEQYLPVCRKHYYNYEEGVSH